MKLKIGLALAAFTLAASPVLARDYFVGDYASKVGACPKQVNCSWFIEPNKGGKTYSVEFEAENWSTNTHLCKIKGTLNRQGKRLVGALDDGQPIEIGFNNAGDLVVSKTTNRPCGLSLPLNGAYGIVAD
ncbi:hypothetical protein J4G37_33425 [Microvirga sp. 3-52]|nr:hypothetical protein [Microvirga sp. 3-52]